jgi:endogenous inhibitor of DNA gyrase (YacG/DUF329 family)
MKSSPSILKVALAQPLSLRRDYGEEKTSSAECPKCQKKSPLNETVRSQYKTMSCPNCGEKVSSDEERFITKKADYSHAQLLEDFVKQNPSNQKLKEQLDKAKGQTQPTQDNAPRTKILQDTNMDFLKSGPDITKIKSDPSAIHAVHDVMERTIPELQNYINEMILHFRSNKTADLVPGLEHGSKQFDPESMKYQKNINNHGVSTTQHQPFQRMPDKIQTLADTAYKALSSGYQKVIKHPDPSKRLVQNETKDKALLRDLGQAAQQKDQAALTRVGPGLTLWTKMLYNKIKEIPYST